MEVLFYGDVSSLSSVITILEYFFILVMIVFNRKIGMLYLISFSILAFGEWSYVINSEESTGFLGMRIGGLSLNIIFIIISSIYCFHTSKFQFPKLKSELKFIHYFIMFSLILGLINVGLGVNYVDNFLQDLKVFIPFYFYLFILNIIDSDSVLKLIKYCVTLTVFSFLLSYALDIKYEYGEGHRYLLMNSIAFITPIFILVTRKVYGNFQYTIMLIIVLFFLLTGNLFISGKTIIMFLILVGWLSYRKLNKFQLLLIPSIFIFISFIPEILQFFINYFDNPIIIYKFSQIIATYSLSFKALASSQNSMGNLVAEAYNIIEYFTNNVFYLLFGKGLGGGVPDVFNNLSSWVGTGGYGQSNLLRNEYFRMHLPLYEIAIKSGILFIVYYLYLLYKGFVEKNIYSFGFLLIFFMVFHASKEMILLALVFVKASENKMDFIKTEGKKYLLKTRFKKEAITYKRNV